MWNYLSRVTVLFIGATILSLVSPAATSAGKPGGGGDPRFAAVELTVPPDYARSSAWGVSNVDTNADVRGVVGSAATGQTGSGGAVSQAMFWTVKKDGRKYQSVPIELAGGQIATGINANWECVGLGDASGATRGLYWENALAAPLVLPPLDGHAHSEARDINIDGVIVGVSWSEWKSSRAVAWRIRFSEGQPEVVGPIDLGIVANWSVASAVNDSNGDGIARIAGTSGSGNVGGVAVWWDVRTRPDGSLTVDNGPVPLGFLAGTLTSGAAGINNADNICGYSDNAGFLTALESGEETMLALPELSRVDGSVSAHDVNDALELAGSAEFIVGGGTEFHAVLWRGGVMIDLDASLPRALRGDSDGFAINNSGEIAGRGRNRAFLLIPK